MLVHVSRCFTKKKVLGIDDCTLACFSHRMLAGPITGNLVVLDRIGLEHTGTFGHKWVVRIGVAEKGADAQQDLADGQSRRPLVLENVQADASVAVGKDGNKLEQLLAKCPHYKLNCLPAYVRVVNLRSKADPRRLCSLCRKLLIGWIIIIFSLLP